MAALGNSSNTPMLRVFPLLDSSETNTADLRTDARNAGAVTSVFSDFYQRMGVGYSSVLSVMVWMTFFFFLIKRIVNRKHYI